MRQIILLLAITFSLSITDTSWAFSVVEISNHINTSGKNEADVLANGINKFEKALKKEFFDEFPCPKTFYIIGSGDMKKWLGVEKQSNLIQYFNDPLQEIIPKIYIERDKIEKTIKELWGDERGNINSEEKLADIIRILSYPKYYLINQISDDKGKVIFNVSLVISHPTRRTNYLLYKGECEMPLGDDASQWYLGGGFGPCSGLAKEVAKSLAYEEPCPYLGTVTLTGNWTRKQTPLNEEHIVSCSGVERKYSHTINVNGNGDEEWDLSRENKNGGRGVALLNGKITTIEMEYDGCPSCREDGCRTCERHWTKKKTENLSHKMDPSERGGADGRVELKFEKNGTYNLLIKAVLNDYQMEKVKKAFSILTTEIAEGSCDTFPERPSPGEKSFNPGAVEQSWLGITGTPFDHRLKEKKTLKVPTPEIGEEKEWTVEFNLEREGGR